MKKFALALAAPVLVLGAIASLALAQTAQVPAPTDFSVITDQIVGIVFAALSAFLVWLGNYVRLWLATKTSFAKTEAAIALQRQYNEAVSWGMAYAESKVKATLPDNVTINSDYLREAADYVLRNWPDLTKGMDREKIKESIIARLPTGPATEDAKMIAVTPAIANG